MSKKKVIECPACHRVMRTSSDVEEASETDHLYLMTASDYLHNMVKIGRSKNVAERACEIQHGLPFCMVIRCIYHGQGSREKHVHEALKPWRISGQPGKEWFSLSAQTAYELIGRILFSGEAIAHQQWHPLPPPGPPRDPASAEAPDD